VQLEEARAVLRVRSPYEAVDLGFALLRKLARPLARVWVVWVFVPQLVVVASFGDAAPWAAVTLLWWLKPLYARVFGLVLGRGLFGASPSGAAFARELWRDGRRGLIADLTLHRLDPARGLVLPVTLLEGLTGKRGRQRRRMLAESSTEVTLGAAFACLGIELAALVGWFALGTLLVPDEVPAFAMRDGAEGWERFLTLLRLGAYALNTSLAEALFVAAGFGLYVNRRTILEGWDIELTFRRMAARLGRALVLLLALGVCAHGASAQEPAGSADGDHTADSADVADAAPADAPPPAGQAAGASQSALTDDARLPLPSPEGREAAGHAMDRLLARPELSREVTTEHWQLRKASGSAEPPGWLTSLASFASTLAELGELLVWAAALLALVAFAVVLLRLVRSAAPARSETHAKERAEVGFAPLGMAALPVHAVVPEALRLVAAGDLTAALSVLYVGTLRALTERDGLSLPDDATEGQCLEAVATAEVPGEHRALFRELTALWQLSAYAHEPPAPPALTALCARFRSCFEGAR
jgi:Domain of unknown function (DUF4129)